MNPEPTSPAQVVGLTAEEARLYDRQIRLWGVGVQQRMRQCRRIALTAAQVAKILLDGFSGVQAELCKNIVLAGIQSVTINDVKTCVPKDLRANFFLDESSLGRNRAEAASERVRGMNPHVKVEIISCPFSEIPLNQFDVCVFSDKSFAEYQEANSRCREAGTCFVIADTFGFFGYLFSDLGDLFKYTKTIKDSRGKEEKKEGKATFVPLSRAMGAHWQKKGNQLAMALKVLYEFERRHGRAPGPFDKPALNELRLELLKHFNLPETTFKEEIFETVVNNQGTELSAVAAIVGGVAAQEVLKVVCANEDPFVNFFLFNSLDGSGLVQHLFDPN